MAKLKAKHLFDLTFVADAQLSPDGKQVAVVQTTVVQPDSTSGGEKPPAYRSHLFLYNTALPDTASHDVLVPDSGVQLTREGEVNTQPRFSPDGGTIVMSVARGGGSDIVSVGTDGGGQRRLTSSGAIDTSPCYSPDGRQIVFNSDRGGDQQLYVMDAGGGGVRRISFGRGRYATPVWSPRGDLIAFTRLNGPTFAIGVMRPDGSGERILSESFSVEGPTFAPNGRVLMFFRQSPARDARGGGFSSRLVSIDITGFNERVVNTPTDASDPAWSPLLA